MLYLVRHQGEYRVLLPDGRTQVVKYYVNGDEGYVAEVTYEGTANFDAAPSGGGGGGYGPPPPTGGNKGSGYGH